MATVATRCVETDFDRANRILERVEDGLNFAHGRELVADFDDVQGRLHWSRNGDKLQVAIVLDGTIDAPSSPESAFEQLYALIRDRANDIRQQLRLGDFLRPVDAEDLRECEDLDAA